MASVERSTQWIIARHAFHRLDGALRRRSCFGRETGSWRARCARRSRRDSRRSGGSSSCSRSSLLSRSTDCGTASGLAPDWWVLAALGFTEAAASRAAVARPSLHHGDERRSVSLDVADLHPRHGGAARRAHRPAAMDGVAISFCGVYLIATQGRPTVPSFNVGDMMALASMMMWAGTRCCCACAATRSARSSFSSSWCAPLAWSSCFLGGWELRFNPSRAHAGRNARVLYSAIGSLLLAYAGWSYVVPAGPRAPGSMHLMPARDGRGARGSLPRRVSELVSLRRHRADSAGGRSRPSELHRPPVAGELEIAAADRVVFL